MQVRKNLPDPVDQDGQEVGALDMHDKGPGKWMRWVDKQIKWGWLSHSGTCPALPCPAVEGQGADLSWLHRASSALGACARRTLGWPTFWTAVRSSRIEKLRDRECK